MENKEETIEHLKITQGIIDRMAQTSFILKGWAITVVVAILGFSVGTSHQLFGFLALFPNIIFWGLDSYYLWQERLFRILYEQVRIESKEISVFCMDTTKCKKITASWIKTIWSPTEYAFYLSMAVFILVASLVRI